MKRVPYHEKIRVGVLRGGPSSEYHISLRTGTNVLANLPEQYQPLDVFVDVSGVWHLHGRREEAHRILGKVDVVFNALHGEYGEDGRVQELLEAHGVPFTGPRRLSAAVSQNKALAKRIVERAGIKTPAYRLFRREEVPAPEVLAGELYRTFPQPCIVKPANRGSSIGVSQARTPDEIVAALAAAFGFSDRVLVEEYIAGKEAVCGVIEGFRGAQYYPLLPIEVRLPPGSSVLDFDTRYGTEDVHRSPGHFSVQEKEALERLAVAVHQLLGLRHYSRSDFIVHPKRDIFFLEADALPDFFGEHSPYLTSLQGVGATFPQFLDHVIRLVQNK